MLKKFRANVLKWGIILHFDHSDPGLVTVENKKNNNKIKAAPGLDRI